MLHNFRSWGIETVMRGIVNGTIAANRRPGSPTTDFRCLLNVRFSQKRKYRHAVLSDALGHSRPFRGAEVVVCSAIMPVLVAAIDSLNAPRKTWMAA